MQYTFLFALGNERKLIDLVKRKFPNANKKVHFSPYIYAKATKKKPLESRKNHGQFFSHVTSFFPWKIIATVFLCFIVGKCNQSVNI